MSDSAPFPQGSSTAARHHPQALRPFPATIGRFDEAEERATMDRLAKWVESRFRDDLQKRPSKHVYVRSLPESIIQQIDRLRDSSVIVDAMRQHFEADSVITPMKHTDELYISHYNKDHGGDQGLYSRHYDGNMRFLRFGAVVRALIYLQSDATYRVVFGDSRVVKAFETYDFGLLDFHRELHWVEGEYNPNDQQRILLKCNYLIAPRNAGFLAVVVEWANTGVFYVVKAAMEYSKSPSNLPEVAVGFLCNAARVLNNVHPLIPLALIGGALAAAAWGVLRLVL
jgi:hypothetical protein